MHCIGFVKLWPICTIRSVLARNTADGDDYYILIIFHYTSCATMEKITFQILVILAKLTHTPGAFNSGFGIEHVFPTLTGIVGNEQRTCCSWT